jgi:deoxyribose-phosphate aldolase
LDDPELHTLVAAITDQILACPSRPEEAHYPCGWECTGCRQRNAEACAEKTTKVVAAGANRVSSCMEVARRNPGVAGLIDHTLLKPEATRSDILRVCREARQFGFASVCVNPYWVPTVASELAASCVKVCTVAGFPLGASAVSIKCAEAEEALRGGAQEIDMVINVGALRSGEYEVVDREIRAVTEACHRAGAIVKTILETAFLDDRQKAVACALARMAGADFVKTSTGFHPSGGASVEAVQVLRANARGMKVKAAGGIRTLETALAMIRAGADRLGCSSSVQIVQRVPLLDEPVA